MPRREGLSTFATWGTLFLDAIDISTERELPLDGGPVVLLVNAGARRGVKKFEEARRLLRENDIEVAHAVSVTTPSSLPRFVQAAIDGGARTVIIGGGDGSLSCAANQIVASGKDVALAALPLGTGNDFVRALGMPRRLDAAVTALARGHRRRVDLGRINGRCFLNAASIGLTTAIAEALTPATKRKFGPFAYAITAARCGLRQQPFLVRMTKPGEPVLELAVLQLVVGNGPFHGGGRRVAPEATLTDSRLDVYAILSGARKDRLKLPRAAQLLRIGARLNRGHHVRAKDVLQFRTSSLEVEATPTQSANVDGELVQADRLVFHVMPRALTVIAP